MDGGLKKQTETKTDRFVRGFNKAAAIATLLTAPMAHVSKAAAQTKERPGIERKSTLEQANLQRMIEQIDRSPVHSFDSNLFTATELKCLTDNTYYEARGEGVQGKYAVIFATLARVLYDKDQNRYPKSICGVVHQPWQFSWTHDKKLLAAPLNSRVYLEVQQQVFNLMKGKTIDEAAILAGMHAGLPHGAIFYKRVGFQGSERVQAFFNTLQSVGIVGNHEFFTVKGKQ